MKYSKIVLVWLLLCCIAVGCKTVPQYDAPIEPLVPPSDISVNFRFIAYDIGITNPDDDKRSYYKVFINKIDAGRTTIGLESQKKYFEGKLSENTHLIVIEKWVLDEREGEYRKANNILQPKPNFFYFETRASSATELIMVNNKATREAQFNVDMR